MEFRTLDEGALYECLSDSGKTYQIRYGGSGDADPDYVSVWACDCPAAQHGKNCKHLPAFFAWKRKADDEAEQAERAEADRLWRNR